MEKYVLEALFQMGEPTFALERMKQRYTRMLDYAEYTTLFEGWGIGAEGFGGGTINHASLETHYGTIQVSIKKKGKRMKFDLQIPEGTSAELIKPNGTRKHLGPGHHQVD